MRKLYIAKDNFELQYIQNELDNSGIPTFTQDPGAGQYLKIVSGINVFGTEVYVTEEDFENASEILNQYLKNESIETKNEKIPWYKNKVIVARIMLGYAIAVGLIIFIVNLIA